MNGERGWDPEVKKLFVRILNSVAWGLIWIITCTTAGIYYKLGHTTGQPVIYPIIFYTLTFITLIVLLRHLNRIWKKN